MSKPKTSTEKEADSRKSKAPRDAAVMAVSSGSGLKALRDAAVIVTVRYICQNLPGKRWREVRSVHVGIGRDSTLEQIMSADAEEVVFEATYKIGRRRDGSPSFMGPLAHGPASQRFTYITWLEKQSLRRCFQRFAAIKIRLSDIPESAIRKAQKANTPIVALVNMTQDDGHVSCATLNPPDIEWKF
jgi:Family of unknown function (DUF5990)